MASFENNASNSSSKTFLCIFCDTTGSMGSWIAALNKMIPQFVRISALTGAFKKIMIVSYKDYDVHESDVVTSTGWLDPFDPKLVDFAKQMQATGGGGMPEAVKSGIYHVLNNLPKRLSAEKGDKLYLIQLTDATAHDELQLDREGSKEKTFLGSEKFDWLTVIQTVASLPISFSIFSTHNSYIPYAALAQVTNGVYFRADYNNLEQGILNIFNGWFGADEDIRFTANKLVRTKGEEDRNETELIQSHTLQSLEVSIMEKHLSEALGTVVSRLDSDEDYRKIVFTLLDQIIRDDVLTLTANKIFGRVWRKVCTMRKDPRRDQLILLIENSKKSLQPAQREKFDAWLRESYNMIEEIKAEIEDLVQTEKCNLTGCIEFLKDVDDQSEPADLVQVLRTLANKDQSYIKNCFARMTINADKVYTSAMMQTALPLHLPVGRLFALILHLVAPGTRFNGRRNQAILAILALNTVLDAPAREFLKKFRGKWLNWTISKEDGKAEIPENFQVKFLYLCKSHREFLLDEEIEKVERLTRLTLCNRIPEMPVTISYEVITSMDGVRQDHHLFCQGCKQSRPLSLVLPGAQQCGYCIFNAEPQTVQTPEATFMVRCSRCRAFYSRDRSIHIMGKSQCHECFNNGTPSHEECVSCKYLFVTYNGLPGQRCKPCELGQKRLEPSFKEHSVTVRQLFEELPPESINQMIGFSYEKGVQNLLEMDMKLTAVTPTDPESLKTLDVSYNNKPVVNFAKVIDEITAVIQSHQIQPLTCDLCCEKKHRSELGRACGRSGCELMVCNDCGGQWYGENKLGHVINLRHCQCMFCARAPTSKVIGRWWNPAASALMRNLPKEMDSTKYYAWCIRCNQAKVCAERACGAGQAPRFTAFECEECQIERVEAERLLQQIRDEKGSISNYDQIKACPACQQPTIRYAGCNHITCVCNVHWCFECGGEFDPSEIYSHMNREHGRIYADEEPFFQNDEEY